MNRGEPERECACILLDEDAEEAFRRTCDSAMQHDRRLLFAFGVDVFATESEGLNEIDLNRRDLPLPAERVFREEVRFRPIERGFACRLEKFDVVGDEGASQGGSRLFPLLIVRHILAARLFTLQRESDFVVFEAIPS